MHYKLIKTVFITDKLLCVFSLSLTLSPFPSIFLYAIAKWHHAKTSQQWHIASALHMNVGVATYKMLKQSIDNSFESRWEVKLRCVISFSHLNSKSICQNECEFHYQVKLYKARSFSLISKIFIFRIWWDDGCCFCWCCCCCCLPIYFGMLQTKRLNCSW